MQVLYIFSFVALVCLTNVCAEGNLRRNLALKNDWFTGQAVTTTNGAVPRTTCPKGYYRPAGGSDLTSVTALRVDGCVGCPRGKYGDTTGLTNPVCSGSCPLGKYSDVTAVTTIKNCKLCPSGRYGQSPGLQSKLCSGKCPVGKYSTAGAVSSASCISCQFNLSGKQRGCTQDMVCMLKIVQCRHSSSSLLFTALDFTCLLIYVFAALINFQF